MRPLSEVFAPGAPTLPERLRTLVVSPERELEPGMTVRAAFTFRNQGGAPATGVRLRFNLPDGLVYLVGSGRIDGRDVDDELGNSPLLSRGGADLGEVAPAEERNVEIAYSVAGAIENGTTVELQAAVASFEVPPVGSNVVRLVARSKPLLANALTRISIEPERDPIPGSGATVTIHIHNAGESTARDVVVVAPVPEHTSYVAGSARINGRDLERDLGAPFDRLYAPLVVASLPARASATLSYRLAIALPLTNGTPILARASIACAQTAAFTLEPSALTVVSAPDFTGERTKLDADPSHGAAPAERVTFALSAHNAGTAAAQRVTVAFEFPEQLLLIRGATTLDGRAVRERKRDPLRFSLGSIEAGATVTLRVGAIVASPIPDASVIPVTASLEWDPAAATSSRRFEYGVVVRSQPDFPRERNRLVRAGNGIVAPGASIEAEITLENDGSADAHDAIVHLRVDPELVDLGIFEGNGRLSLAGRAPGHPPDSVELGTIDAYSVRKVAVRGRVPSPCVNGSEVSLLASLHTRELGETALPAATWIVDSHPAFDCETSRLELAGDSVLRPNQLATVDVDVANVGTDVANNVALRLYITPEARLESVDGAAREKSTLLLGAIPPGGHARVRLGVRLLRGLAKDWPVTIDALLTADAMLPVPLTALTIATSAQPDFAAASFASDPAHTVDAGETVEWTLHVRNNGDGTAKLVQIAVTAPDALTYVPNSTSVNDVPVRDSGTLAPFAAQRGIVLNEVDPGVEASIRWRSVVQNAVAADVSLRHVAHVRYDGDRDDQVVSDDLRVRAIPIFANAIPGLPFGLDGMIGPASSATPALGRERYVQLPPATPVLESNGIAFAQLSAGDETAPGIAGVTFTTQAHPDRTGTVTAFSAERLARTLRFLREARFSGLISHLFALRAFVPDAIGDGYLAALTTTRDLLREEMDRLFIKLRLPSYVIAIRDVETPSLHATVERLARESGTARGTPADPPTASLQLLGSFDPAEMLEFADRIASASLAAATPWRALARLLPDETPAAGAYRSSLIETLDAYADAEPSEFVDALQSRTVVALDAALDDLTASLHAPV